MRSLSVADLLEVLAIILFVIVPGSIGAAFIVAQVLNHLRWV